MLALVVAEAIQDYYGSSTSGNGSGSCVVMMVLVVIQSSDDAYGFGGWLNVV